MSICQVALAMLTHSSWIIGCKHWIGSH